MKFIVKKYKDLASKNHNLNIILSNLLFLTALLVIFSNTSPYFLTKLNLLNVISQLSLYLVLGVGLTLIMASGEIDISIGSMVGLNAAVLGIIILKYGLPWWFGVICCLAVGTLCGAFNGFLVSKFKVPSIIVTLGTLTLFNALTYIFIGGKDVVAGAAQVYYNFPEEILWFYKRIFFGINNAVIIAIVVWLIGSYFLTKTTTGKYLIATGANKNIALLSGIRVNYIKFFPFLIMGFLTGVAALILTGRLNATQANIATGLEMKIIAGVVLGGTSIMGGKALMSGTILGIIIIAVLENGTSVSGMTYDWRQTLVGILFIAVVTIYTWRQKEVNLEN